MSDFHVRSDAVDVEQIMRQIRARIREKRGADYTEAEVKQLAEVKLEKFLDPRGVRSDLVDAFRRHRIVSSDPPTYEFEDTTLYETHRGLLRTIRRLLHPILKLFINPAPLVQALHTQKQINAEYHRRFRQREELDPLYYEVLHNLVVEVTRATIEVQNLKMRVESLSSRLDFDERRARSLEGAVEFRPPRPQGPPQRPSQPPAEGDRTAAPAATGTGDASNRPPNVQPGGTASAGSADQAGGERRRRRRRRRRRPGQHGGAFAGPGSTSAPPGGADESAASDQADDAGGDDGAAEE